MMVLALLAALVGDAPPAFPDPIAPASEGKAQCYSPNIARKVCASLAIYGRGADGGLVNTTTVLLANAPPITMTTVSNVTDSNGRLCGVMQIAELDAAKFTVSGAPADAARADQLHTAVANAFASIIDHTLCVSFVVDGSGFTARSTLDSVPRPTLDQRVIWVSPTDGWKVAP